MTIIPSIIKWTLVSLDLELHEAWKIRGLTGLMGSNALQKEPFFCLIQEIKARVKEVCGDVS